MDFHQKVCALILWRSGLELLNGRFCQFLHGLLRRASFRPFVHPSINICLGCLVSANKQENRTYNVTGYGVRPSINFFVSG